MASNTKRKIKVNLGSGEDYKEGWVNVDINTNSNPDIIHNLAIFPYPFEDEEAEEVMLNMVLEHLKDTHKVMAEVYRILKPGGKVSIIVPHYLHMSAWSDPDHKKAFAPNTFRYYDPKYGYANSNGLTKFNLIKEEVRGIHYGDFEYFRFIPNSILKFLSFYIPGIVEDIIVELRK